MKLLIYKQPNGQTTTIECDSNAILDAAVATAFTKHKATQVRVYTAVAAYDLAPKVDYVRTSVAGYPSDGGY